ncbi:hypothetical protein G6F57_015761 [Rhizopus arrhizus]|nr:hypothetical protein G6F57_015761 [Rhizopus arrhizus]
MARKVANDRPSMAPRCDTPVFTSSSGVIVMITASQQRNGLIGARPEHRHPHAQADHADDVAVADLERHAERTVRQQAKAPEQGPAEKAQACEQFHGAVRTVGKDAKRNGAPRPLCERISSGKVLRNALVRHRPAEFGQMHVVAHHAGFERDTVEIQATHLIPLAHARNGSHHRVEALDVQDELGIERLNDEIRLHLALLQQGHDARQITQLGAGDRVHVGEFVARWRIQRCQVLLVVVVADVVGIVAAQAAFDFARLVRQPAPLPFVQAGGRRPGHEAVRRHGQLAARTVRRGLFAGMPP